MVLRKLGSRMGAIRGARRIAVGVVLLLSLLTAGCDNPVLDALKTLRAETVTNAAAADEKDLTAFSIKDPGVIGTISGTNVAVTVPTGTDLTSLVAIFTITGASVTVNGVTQTSNVTINDFTNPVGYLVAASDGTTKLYTVTVTTGVTTPILSTTAAAANITTTTAAGGGTISNNGGATITVSGICWSTSQSPTVDSCTGKTTNGPVAAGSWSNSSMTSLSAGTTYYVRAYATNSIGTGYGAQVNFTTLTVIPAAPTLTIIGGTDGSGKLSVSWTAAPSATLYEVYCGTGTSFSSASLNDGGTDIASTSTSCTLTGLTNYTTTYYVWVVAKNATGTGPASASSSSTVGVRVTGITLQRQADTQSISGGRTADAFVYYSRDTLVATLATADGKDPTDPTVTWSPSSTTYATISASGLTCLVTAGSVAGSETVTATANDGSAKSATCTITVTSNAAGSTGPGGGKILYDKTSYTDGWRYLETAVYSSSNKLHGTWGWNIGSGLSSLSMTCGYGPSNTTLLVSTFGTSTSTAGYIAHNYRDSATGGVFSDWFLPTSGEMEINGITTWRSYSALPQYFAAWSSYGASDGSGGYIYSYQNYNLNETVGWVWATSTADANNAFLVIPMRRF